MRTTYHGEDDIRLCNDALKGLLRDGTSLFQRLAPRDCAIAIVKWCQTLGSKVLLKVQGHSNSHGPEAILYYD